jgi:hypothetical protein
MRKLGAGHIEPHRLGASCEEESAESMPAAVRHLNVCGVNIDCSDAPAKSYIDFVLTVKLLGPK